MHLALKSAMSRIPYTNKVGETLGSIADPAAAYSLRALNGGDPTVARVRRSSDDDEKDFTASDVNGGALVNWVGSGNDGFVTSWYDQLGNDNHATQSTAGSQPKIVDGGVLVAGGLDFDGVDDFLLRTSLNQGSLSQPNSIFSLTKLNTNDEQNRQVYNGGSGRHSLLLRDINTGEFSIFSGEFLSTGNTADNNVHLFSCIYNTNNSELIIDGVLEVSGNSGTESMSGISIGSNPTGTSGFWSGSISEIIIYNSDQSANRTAIETNINNHYDIY